MTYHPALFGHLEDLRVDRRDPRPPRFAEIKLRRRGRRR
jgi:hypothetical protein